MVKCDVRSGWVARSKYLSSNVFNCTAILTYTAELVQPGLVAFTYQHDDDSILFTFEVSLCHVSFSCLLCMVSRTNGSIYLSVAQTKYRLVHKNVLNLLHCYFVHPK